MNEMNNSVSTKAEPAAKLCRQCGLVHPISDFRWNRPRGTGKYNTKISRHTVCSLCENINAAALTRERKGWPDDTDKQKYMKVYSLMKGKLPPVARRLLGLDQDPSVAPTKRASAADALLGMFESNPVPQPTVKATTDVQGTQSELDPNMPVDTIRMHLLNRDCDDYDLEEIMSNRSDEMTDSDWRMLSEWQGVDYNN